MSAHMPDVNPVIDGVAGRSLPATANLLSLVAMGLGVVGIGYGFAVAGAAWTLGAILVGILYLLALSQGGVMFALILTGTWGRWGRPLKRIAETFGFFMPIAWLLLVAFAVLGNGIYPWNPNTILEIGPVALAPHSAAAWASKELWLALPFFIARQVFLVGLLVAMDLVYLRASLRPDLMMAKARLGAKAPAWWDRIIGGATNLEVEVEASRKTMAFLVPFLGLAYALVFSFLAFDMIMSLSPWWASNMFGGWQFASSVWVSLACLGVVSMVSRDWLRLGPFVKPNVTHDLGKLLLAFTMFWAYTGFAQLLPIWYTDMPEETDFLLVRLYLPQWVWLSRAVAVTCFLAPFTILLSRGIKKMRWPFVGICSLIMVGVFLERSLLVMPSVYFGDTFPLLNFVVVNVFIWLGCLGFFAAVVGRVLASVVPLVVSDPFLEPHPWDVHVHSLDAHH